MFVSQTDNASLTMFNKGLLRHNDVTFDSSSQYIQTRITDKTIYYIVFKTAKVGCNIIIWRHKSAFDEKDGYNTLIDIIILILFFYPEIIVKRIVPRTDYGLATKPHE